MESDWFEELPDEFERWLRTAAQTPLTFKCGKYDPREVAQQLYARDYETSVEAAHGVWCVLEHAGSAYRRWPSSQLKRDGAERVENLARQAMAVRATLASMLPSPESIGDSRSAANREALRQLMGANEALKRAAWIRNGGLPKDGGFLYIGCNLNIAIEPTIERILYDIDHLVNLTAHVRETAPKAPLGKPRNDKLRHWVKHVGWAWDRHIGKKKSVTFDSDRKPSSDFAAFMWWALDKLDPKALGQLANILDEYRTEENVEKVN